MIAPIFSAFHLAMMRTQSEAAALLSARSIAAIAAAERFLDGSRYLAGDRYTLADLVAATIVHASRDMIEWKSLPLLARWFDDVSNRPEVIGGMHAFDAVTG